MVYANVIYKAVEEVALKQTDRLNASSIQKNVEEKAEQPVSTQKIGWYLGVLAKIYHFQTRGARDKGKEYLPRALLFGRD